MKLRMNWGLGIALTYAGFACGTLGVVAFATTQPIDLVSADYYARSLHQDARREAIARATALGTELRIETAADEREVLVALPPAQAPTASGVFRWYRPSDARADRVVALRVDRDGRQRLSLTDLAPGYWVLQLEWTADGHAYYDEHMVQIR
jgi:hypothetical protein